MLLATQRREDDLMRDARMFNDDLRWARWDSMGASMPAEDKRLFLERVESGGNDLVMCDYEVKSVHFDTGSSGDRDVTIEWYAKNDPAYARPPSSSTGRAATALDDDQAAALSW